MEGGGSFGEEGEDGDCFFGGKVGGWVGWVEEAVRMSCCGLEVGWVGWRRRRFE